jgi:RNA polymerase sigma-70 factor, ECF subfamily
MGSKAAGPEDSDESASGLLAQLSAGNREAEARLFALVYEELRRLARRYMRQERADHTLQPTALLHEAYTRLVQQRPAAWEGRAHFFAAASHVMRHILVDHARARAASKRGGLLQQVTLDDALALTPNRSIDVMALHEAMERLETFDRRPARVVELHFFGGLTFEEIASVLNVGVRTVKRDWSMARAWLKVELSRKP